MGELLITLDFDLVAGKFLRRLNRFTALAKVNSEEVYAHLPNSGRLTTALNSGETAYFRMRKARAGEKSVYSMFAIQYGAVPIIVDAQFSNFLAETAIKAGLIHDLAGYSIIKRNFRPDKRSKVRLDFAAEKSSELFYIEVKCVTHVVDSTALFPDAPTRRGRQHIIELTALLERGFKSGLIFSVQRPDAHIVKPNLEVDPEFAVLLENALLKGLKIFTIKSTFKPLRTIILDSDGVRFKI
ncbi:MAG: DNA/RNA nuclease SfsA [Candidatus Bathyarchaeota archaeon]|nr:DNA/RNA nuclease SfsA [Candidatus Bathyarchaeota archaeon]